MFRKYIYFILFVGISSYGQSINWLDSYKRAIKDAKKSKKNILIYFTGSDWCSPCKSLKADFFETEKFERLSNEFVLLKLDFPRNLDLISEEQRKENKILLSKYNIDKKFPKIVVVDKREKIKGVESGYGMLRDPSPYEKLLNKYKN